ncbi:MAG: tRNA-(ms[2]io[6]A)-hydroxylase [Gammaproteobacteria bacterium]|jgi:tRNA-(ms[2]io[6]A)-hydroxylase|nr:tRNA-(ms[2]io[6]A)-hydroxylase [Gammaproteobacteria bacterium]
MARIDLSQLSPLAATPSGWLETVLADFDGFLMDHASAEKKASGMAMSMVSHYPDQPSIVRAMIELAVEELNHYREVMRLILARQLTPAADLKDPYIHALNGQVRKAAEHFLLDRLTVAAVVERRGAERFALVADSLCDDPALQRFYQAIATSEQRHWELFIDLAVEHFDVATVIERFNELSQREAKIIQTLPLRAALH